MDVPFLGVQNSVILTGIMGPFQSKAEPTDLSDGMMLGESLRQVAST
jgi:hypothetical protein